jgi:hypothetical protein
MTQFTASPQALSPGGTTPGGASPDGVALGSAAPTAGTPRTPAQRIAARWRQVRADIRQTPGRMRLVSAGLVVAGLLAAAGGAQAFRTAQGALERADANASQLVRLQLIQTSLVSADADATNAFLEGGLEPVEQRRDYDQALRQASAQIAYAARAQPADGTALAALNNDLQDYTGQVQLARANNRQGLPVGAQYLRAASATLRVGALPLLDNLTAANEQRARQEFSAARAALAWLMITYPVVLAALVAALIWLARRTHRYLNVPLAGAGLVALIALIGGLVVLGSMAAGVLDVRDGPYAGARALADARVAAFDAKANESLTLVSRGSGASFEAAWKKAAGEVTTAWRRAPPARTPNPPGSSTPPCTVRSGRSMRPAAGTKPWPRPPAGPPKAPTAGSTPSTRPPTPTCARPARPRPTSCGTPVAA